MTRTFRVEVHDGRPVVTVTGTGEAAARVRAEAERLRAATHPGVVDVLDDGPVDDGWRLRTAHAGRPLDTVVSLPVEQVAAIVASLAATLADLHHLGLVHGRLAADHVLIGASGRPRLCGFGPGPQPGEPAPTAPDDVAALGRLLAALVGADGEAEPIPERRWSRRRRWGGLHRRALLNLADQATSEVATQRPTARRLAATLVEAVPAARLAPPPPPSDPGAPTAAQPRTAGPLERLQTLPAATPRSYHPGARTLADPNAAPPPSTPTPPTTTAHHPLRQRRERAGPAGPRHAAEGPGHRRRQGQGRRLPGPVPAAAALIGVALIAVGVARTTTDGTARPDGDAGLPTAPSSAGTGPADPVPPTTTGPSTASTTPSPTTSSPTTGSPPTTSTITTSTITTSTTPSPPSRPDCPAVPAPGPDLDGDGCPDPVTLHGSVLQVGDRRFAVAEPGDIVVLGDWSCDGTATPAALRPGTGEVFAFPAWPEPGGELTVELTDRIAGAVDLVAEDLGGGCDGLTAELADGRRVQVVVPWR